MDTRSEKLLVIWLKLENQMLKRRKTANRNRHQNWKKLEFLGAKTEKPTLKMAETENPNAPLQ